MLNSRLGNNPATQWRGKERSYATTFPKTNPCTLAEAQQMTDEQLLAAEIKSYMTRMRDISILTIDQKIILAGDGEKIIAFAHEIGRTDLILPEVIF